MKNRYRNKAEKLFTVSLALLAVCTVLAGIIIPDRDFSVNEKRPLTVLSSFSGTSAADGSLQKTAGKYMDDQFPGRDKMVTVHSDVMRFAGSRKIDDVYIAEDRLIQEYKGVSDKKSEELADAINRFAEKNDGLAVDVLIAPTAYGIYSEEIPKKAPVKKQRNDIGEFYSRLSSDIGTVSVGNALEKAAEKYEIYYRSDHHWTSDGAVTAAAEYGKLKGFDIKRDNYSKLKVSDNFFGTLAGKTGIMDFPDSVDVFMPESEKDRCRVTYADENRTEYSLYQPDMMDSDSQYNIFTGGNHPLVRIETSCDSGRRLLVVKDSYANSFLPFLTPYFTDITVVDPRYYFDSMEALVKKDGITDVLFLYNASTFFEDESLSDCLKS